MITDKYLNYIQEGEFTNRVQKNLIDLKYGDNPTIHALKMGELQKNIAARKALVKRGVIGLGIAGATVGGYKLYKKLKNKPTKENMKLYEQYLYKLGIFKHPEI